MGCHLHGDDGGGGDEYGCMWCPPLAREER